MQQIYLELLTDLWLIQLVAHQQFHMYFYSGLLFKQSLHVKDKPNLSKLKSRVFDDLSWFDIGDVAGLCYLGSILDRVWYTFFHD